MRNLRSSIFNIGGYENYHEIDQITKRIMIMKRLIIEQLKEGFIFTDENDEKYAISDAMLSTKVNAYFGLTKFKPKPKSKSSSMNDKTMPLGAQGEIPVSLSSGTEQSGSNPASGGINKGEKPIPSETKLGTPDNNLVQSGQCAEIQEIPGFDSPAAPLILHPSNLKRSPFNFDLLAKMQKYKTLKFLELPNGRVVLQYANSRYYTEREKVMQIPFPFPKKYFSKENGWSSSVEQAFKMYRRYLDERKEPEGQPDGTCDDVSFETCANNDPETCKFCVDGSRYEDKQKIAARKPGAPLLKARMGV